MSRVLVTKQRLCGWGSSDKSWDFCHTLFVTKFDILNGTDSFPTSTSGITGVLCFVITNEIVPSNKQFRSFKLEIWHVKRKGKSCCLHCIVLLFLVNAPDLSHPHGPPPFGLVFPANICLYFTLRDRGHLSNECSQLAAKSLRYQIL